MNIVSFPDYSDKLSWRELHDTKVFFSFYCITIYITDIKRQKGHNKIIFSPAFAFHVVTICLSNILFVNPSSGANGNVCRVVVYIYIYIYIYQNEHLRGFRYINILYRPYQCFYCLNPLWDHFTKNEGSSCACKNKHFPNCLSACHSISISDYRSARIT